MGSHQCTDAYCQKLVSIGSPFQLSNFKPEIVFFLIKFFFIPLFKERKHGLESVNLFVYLRNLNAVDWVFQC